MDVPERRSSLAPARLLIGSLVLGGGIVALGLLFGGGTANAAEPPAPSPLGGVVAAVAAVAPAAPAPAASAPVAEVAAQVVQPVASDVEKVAGGTANAAEPVASDVRQVAAAAPVEAVVSTVAATADRVVAAPVQLVAPGAATPASGGGTSTGTASEAPAQAADTPASQAPAPQTSLTLSLVRTLAAPLAPVTSLLANHPVSTLTAPIAAAADGVLAGVAGVAGVVVHTVQPLAAPAGVAPAGEQSALPSADVQPVVAGVDAANTVRAGASSYSPAAPPATGAPSALLADAPHGDSDVPVPGTPSGVLGVSTSGAPAGGYGSGVATLGGNASPATALGVRAGVPADVDLPASPVFDHDISPD